MIKLSALFTTLVASISGCLHANYSRFRRRLISILRYPYRPLYRAVYKIFAVVNIIMLSYRPLYRAVYGLDIFMTILDKMSYRPLYRAVYEQGIH